MSETERLESAILDLVGQYYVARHMLQPFVPGVSPVPVSGKVFNADEMVSLTRAVLDFWLTDGPYAKQFAQALQRVCGVRHAILCNSGSSANLLAVTALARPGRKVVTTALGFPTTLNPILQNQMIPVFVDVDPETYVPRRESVEAAIKEHGADLVVLAHTLGNVAPIFDRRVGADLIYDACDAMMSRYDGEPVTSYGDLSTLSFYPAHHMTSLDYEEPIIVRDSGGVVRVMRIGEFVNVYYATDTWECMAFDRTGLIQFQKVTGVVSHPVNEPLCRITTQTGRKAVVSKSHSVFTLQDNTITPCIVKDLHIGDYIVVPNKLPSPPEVSTVPYTKYKKGSWEPYQDSVNITPELGELLGYFIAEGSLTSNDGGYHIAFTFGSGEEPFASKVLTHLSQIFGIKGRVYIDNEKSRIDVQASGKALFQFLQKHCGRGAENKHIPSFIFSASTKTKQALVKAYYEGDGNSHCTYGAHVGSSMDCKTVSQRLATEMVYLLLQLGINPRHSTQAGSIRDFGRYISHGKPTYSVCYSKKSLVSARGFRGRKTSSRQLGDLSMVKITKIEEVESTDPNVFDLSVEGFENFVGGVGMVLHNTGEGGAVLTRSPQLKRDIESLCGWGRSCFCPTGKDNTCGKRYNQQFGDLPYGYDHKYVYSRIGYNLKMTDLQAAVGLAQIDKLPAFILKRRNNFNFYDLCMMQWEQYFILPKASSIDADPSWFGYPLTIRDDAPFTRLDLLRYLEEKKIGTRLMFGGNLLRQPAYKDIDCIVAEPLGASNAITENGFWIGVYPGITIPMREYVVDCLDNFLRRY